MRPYQRLDPDTGGGGEDAGSPSARGSTRVPIIHKGAKPPSREGFRSEFARTQLARAESAGDLTEFHALAFQAILALAEGSELASDYLEMAEAVADSEHERAIVAGIRATRDCVQRSLVAEHRQGGSAPAAELWQSLLIALASLGDAEPLDTTPEPTAWLAQR